ncbi:molybdopterin biosynthesis protein, related [Neospora caninum Liverpool]|uniref:molybdopterin adenylyltransferase n=1 Tax=Neospora caninum (strain Liverpool) TaxID=572307 RepID=F0V755_NEOCL|nr:molybdopterin biosynthesis protein, related [Neospora caninum Liverpool]CBZ49546.1 molybdopterin biosynthesis protein, related [Neospora caninum Liverpool]CEL64125.1 TPA: Molybdopterin biosynthesis protein, related [Neospora caninum Liverpool]|eukprot:XP_003879581.1 molybdopterin biosynthesis protein, related [Neospora caninum Liverpool]
MRQKGKRKDAANRGPPGSGQSLAIGEAGAQCRAAASPGPLTPASSSRSPSSACLNHDAALGQGETSLMNGHGLVREVSSFRMLELSEAQFLVDCEVRRLIHSHVHRFNLLRGKTKLSAGPPHSEEYASSCPGGNEVARHQEKESRAETCDSQKTASRRLGGPCVGEPPLTCYISPPFLDRRVATSVIAPRPFPAFRASLVDGYAIRLTPDAGGLRQASRSVSISHGRAPDARDESCRALRIVQKVRAGGVAVPFRGQQLPKSPQASEVGDASGKQREESRSRAKSANGCQEEAWNDVSADSTCVYVTTGAPVPAQFQAVVPVEDCVVDLERSLCIPDPTAVAALRPGANIRAIGSDVAAGVPLLEQGQRVGPAEEGLLASFDIRRLEVYRRLNVHTLAIGDELVSRVAGAGQRAKQEKELCGRSRGSQAAASASSEETAQAGASPPLSPAAALANKRFSLGDGSRSPAEVYDSNSPTLAALITDRCPSVRVLAQHFLPDDVAAVRALLIDLATGTRRGKPADWSEEQPRAQGEQGEAVRCECSWCTEVDAQSHVSGSGATGGPNVDPGVDVLLTTGGVSMGDSDCIKLALLQLQEETKKRQEERQNGRQGNLGSGRVSAELETTGERQLPVCARGCCSFRVDTEIHFGRLNVKPGKPTIVASLRVYRSSSEDLQGSAKGTATDASPCRTLLVFGLPGNPCSSWVLFHLLVGPALQFFSSFSPSSSLSSHLPPQLPVGLTAPLRPDPSRPEFQRSLVYVDFNAGTDCRRHSDAQPSLCDFPVPHSLFPPTCEGALASSDARNGSLPASQAALQQVYLHAVPTGDQQSSRLLSCCGNANALLLVPPTQRSGRDRHEAGEVLWAWLLGAPFPAPPKMLLKLLTLQEERQQRAQGRPAGIERESSLSYSVGRCRCGESRSREASERIRPQQAGVHASDFWPASAQRTSTSGSSLGQDTRSRTGDRGQTAVLTKHHSHRHALGKAPEKRTCFLGVVVVSDRCSGGTMKDACVEAALTTLRSSPGLAELVHLNGDPVESEKTVGTERELVHGGHFATRVVPDERDAIQEAVLSLVCRYTNPRSQAMGSGNAICGDEPADQTVRPCLIFVCGGTGLSVRDVTPQSLLPLFSVRCSGLEHLLMQESLTCTPMAALGRPCAGIVTCTRQAAKDVHRSRDAWATQAGECHGKQLPAGWTPHDVVEPGTGDQPDAQSVCDCGARALVFGLPGSPQAVRECIQALSPVLPHALDVVTSGA